MAMKRVLENGEIAEMLAMANYLMWLSHSHSLDLESKPVKHLAREVFECKTCNRKFPSFQALGGHRASHKRPRLMGEKALNGESKPSKMKTKLHECTLCGQEFGMGQALGGHMRRHRVAMNEGSDSTAVVDDASVEKIE